MFAFLHYVTEYEKYLENWKIDFKLSFGGLKSWNEKHSQVMKWMMGHLSSCCWVLVDCGNSSLYFMVLYLKLASLFEFFITWDPLPLTISPSCAGIIFAFTDSHLCINQVVLEIWQVQPVPTRRSVLLMYWMVEIVQRFEIFYIVMFFSTLYRTFTGGGQESIFLFDWIFLLAGLLKFNLVFTPYIDSQMTC